jgi:predicted DCC family thiol-disulfide oxidoreductase YuxK
MAVDASECRMDGQMTNLSNGSAEKLKAAATPLATSIVYFDGVCGMCNRTVDFVLKRDRRGHFQFAPLQGETAAARLPQGDRQLLSTLVLQTPQGEFRRSAAVVGILQGLGGMWWIAGSLLWIVPRPLRDWVYRLIAGNRYRLFGKKETCRLPTPEEAGRLLP